MGIEDDEPLDKLFPALIECFGVIICGYAAGRIGVITPQQSKGLATFVGTFSLPSLIFMSLATLDLSSVCWYFLLSILVSKAIVFTSVLLITLLVTRPVDPGKAGLYAIFCTQSNDFAIGFPIILSAYGKSHPEFVSYLYLLAPVSLVMLNPIGFVLMEIGKMKSRGGGTSYQLLKSTVTNIATNPVVFMTALGIAGNFIFRHNVPTALAGLLNVFGSAFTASALFLLGLHMVGKVQTLQGTALIVPGILITVKELMLPVVVREVTSLILHASSVNSSASTDMSNYGFLYGTLPAAPGVFVYATSYALDVDLIASAMVACTFLSAPLMFVSAKMVSVSNLSPTDFFPTLEKFDFDLSIAGLVACLWLLALFIGLGKFKKFPQRITLFLIISQMVGCIGILVGYIGVPNIGYIKYSLVTFGNFSSSLWAACLAVTMVLIESRNFAFLKKIQPAFIGLSWGIPLLFVARV
ncbi:hypothetical protein AAG570_006818 [Ranatra chinensis]|uniref:G-protein coupled receptors family 2 profile 2 domain-containing protein n=1 Tax=Ranatra chinensis TaxID=642074 RepID=A0ABD0YV79_9HEMI